MKYLRLKRNPSIEPITLPSLHPTLAYVILSRFLHEFRVNLLSSRNDVQRKSHGSSQAQTVTFQFGDAFLQANQKNEDFPREKLRFTHLNDVVVPQMALIINQMFNGFEAQAVK